VIDETFGSELMLRFAQTRALMNGSAAHAEPSDQVCRYCGKPWQRWPGSKIDGHAKCYVDPMFRRWLVDATARSSVTYREIADLLGTTISIVRAWCAPRSPVC